MKNLIDELAWRGLVYQKTPNTEKAFEKKTTIYIGYDPTGPDLHIGHLMGIVLLKRAYDYGHNIIILVGGGTAKIGDPGGKDAERPILPKEKIEENKAKMKEQFSHFFTFDDDRVRMVDNAEWLEQLSLIEFLREAGKYMSINSMLDKDSVKSRIERQDGMSYAEFSYQLLQAYDFFNLYQTYGCEVQLGGSDQWGNIVQGVELIRKKIAKEVYALSFPLIVDPQTGKKFGKTEQGAAIWLDKNKTHPFHFYQFLVNVSDDLAPHLMRYFSFKSKEEIEAIEKKWVDEKEKRTLQKELAYELTASLHGHEVADRVRRVVTNLFEKGNESLQLQDLEFMKTAMPHLTVSSKDVPLDDLLVQFNFVPSKGQAKRLIEQGGASVTPYFDRFLLVRKGKREYGMVEIKG
jgi:tyrosyl-tRNA synthetase